MEELLRRCHLLRELRLCSPSRRTTRVLISIIKTAKTTSMHAQGLTLKIKVSRLTLREAIPRMTRLLRTQALLV